MQLTWCGAQLSERSTKLSWTEGKDGIIYKFKGDCRKDLLEILKLFYGISTFVGYLMPNPFLYKWKALFQTNCIFMLNWLVGWLLGFYGKSIFVGYLMPNPFLFNNQFSLKQFSSAQVCSPSVSTVQLWKTFLFQAIQFSQAIIIQLIQFSMSTGFVYIQLNVKTVLY